MTTDPFTTAATAEARRESPLYDNEVLSYGVRMAVWARDHLAAQKPSDAEVLSALNAQGVVMSPKMHPAPSLDYWGERATEAMRAALTAAKEARR